MDPRQYSDCLICGSNAHPTAECYVSNVAKETGTELERENYSLTTNVDFRLRNELDLGPLYDQYGRERVDRVASRLTAAPRSPGPSDALSGTNVPHAPSRSRRHRRVAPLTSGFRIAKRRLSFPPTPKYVSWSDHLKLDNCYTILRHKYNRLLALYHTGCERTEKLSDELSRSKNDRQSQFPASRRLLGARARRTVDTRHPLKT